MRKWNEQRAMVGADGGSGSAPKRVADGADDRSGSVPKRAPAARMRGPARRSQVINRRSVAVGAAGRTRVSNSAVGVALGSLVLLSACASSAPLRYYTLSEVPPATAPTSTVPAIHVGRVRIPGELDRTELVQRIDATRLKIAEQDRWAAPLDEMIRRALSADLQARGATASPAAASPAPSSAPDAASPTMAPPKDASVGSPATLSLDVEELIGDASCGVTLRASWELRSAAASAAPARMGQEAIRLPPSSGTCTVGALPMAMSQALAQLSDRILAAAR
jgi:uncharacterized lipoprotein YmbA